MSTDFQRAREALGVRLRELRTEAGVSGRGVAHRLSWSPSKVSKLENGRQTPTLDDLAAWADAVGNPGVTAELQAALRGLETRYRTWQRQLAAGHQARQEQGVAEIQRTKQLRGLEVTRVPGLLQTAEYARCMFGVNAAFQQSTADTEAAVRARIRRQEVLYDTGRRLHFLMWEGALHVLTTPRGVMLGQLDRLTTLLGLDTVTLGIIPLGAPLRRTPAHGFWIYDTRLVIVETINAELWLDDAADIALYERAWEWLAEAAVYGPSAHRLIMRARAALDRP